MISMPIDQHPEQRRQVWLKRGYKYVLQDTVIVEVPELVMTLMGMSDPEKPIELFMGKLKLILLRFDAGTGRATLVVFPPYAWDGASGPTIDDRTSYVASLVHDAISNLGREEKIPFEAKLAADLIMLRLISEDIEYVWRSPEYTGSWWEQIKQRSLAATYKTTRGALKFRAQAWYQAVRFGADESFKKSALKPVEIFP